MDQNDRALLAFSILASTSVAVLFFVLQWIKPGSYLSFYAALSLFFLFLALRIPNTSLWSFVVSATILTLGPIMLYVLRDGVIALVMLLVIPLLALFRLFISAMRNDTSTNENKS